MNINALSFLIVEHHSHFGRWHRVPFRFYFEIFCWSYSSKYIVPVLECLLFPLFKLLLNTEKLKIQWVAFMSRKQNRCLFPLSLNKYKASSLESFLANVKTEVWHGKFASVWNHTQRVTFVWKAIHCICIFKTSEILFPPRVCLTNQKLDSFGVNWNKFTFIH